MKSKDVLSILIFVICILVVLSPFVYMFLLADKNYNEYEKKNRERFVQESIIENSEYLTQTY